MVEHGVRARIESEAVRHGAVARIGVVHVGVWPLLRLEGFDLDLRSGVRLHADMIAATWPGRLRLAVRARHSRGASRGQGQLAATAWDMAGIFGETSGSRWWSHRPACQSASWRIRWAARGISRHVGSTSDVCSRCGATPTAARWWYSRTVRVNFRPAPMRSVSTWHGRTRRALGSAGG